MSSSQMQSGRDKLPIGQKAAFGTGNLVVNLLPGALGVFQFFLLTAFGIDPFLAGLLGGLPRLLDALTDPIMGYTAETMTNLRLADILIPAFTAGLAILVMWKYDLTESKAREIKEELIRRRGDL